MSFEEYASKAEFITILNRRVRNRTVAKKVALFGGIPLMVIGALLSVLGDGLELFEMGGNLVPTIVGAVCMVLACISFSVYMCMVGAGNAGYSPEWLFPAERLYAEQILSEFFQSIPKEGTVTVFYDVDRTGNTLKLSLDEQNFREYDVSAFRGALNPNDYCIMFTAAYFPIMEQNSMKGYRLTSLCFRAVVRKLTLQEREDLRIFRKGKLTMAGQSAYKRYQKLKAKDDNHLINL